ncbi:MAG: DMT family transporter [Chloroflexi bacterium]|nr:DMT family transporter [Chloroflexota bacterium]
MIFGALLALASAFSFSVNFILVRRGFADAGATAAQGAFITVLLGVPFGLVAVIVTGQLFNFGRISPEGYLLLAAAGIVHFGIGRYCNYRGIATIGAPRAATIQAIAVPYSIVMAMLLLGERPTLLMYVGIALILGSPALMIDRRKRPASSAAPSQGSAAPASAAPASAATSAAPAVEMRMAEGYTFSLLAAAAYGTSPILIRAAVEDASDVAAIGTFVAYIGASAMLLAMLALPAQRHLVGTINFRYMRLFGGAGLSVFMAQLLRFFALSIAEVSIVNPLMRMIGVFTLILSYLVNRRLEHITLGVVLGVLVSFAGSALLVVAATGR